MSKALSKLALARTYIKSHKIKADARNDFSQYDYFSPALVGKMVTEACIEVDAICVFNLKKDELGYYGELMFTDLESGENIVSIMRTEKPVIKATNETQQMGGMNTYTKRYCLMSLFDIEDNTMDFDAQDNTQKKETTKQSAKQIENKPTLSNDDKPWLNKGKEYDAIIGRLQKGTATIQQVLQHYKLNKQIRAELEACMQKDELLEETPF